MKERSITLERYFQLIKPQYTYIKITPDKSIRNYNSTNIVKTISHTWKSLDRRIRIEQKKLFFETSFKVSYVIDITNNNANFYFIVPKPFLTILLEKISEIWPKATIEEVESIKGFSNKALTYQLLYKKEDALSLMVDKKSNETLNQILNVLSIMQEDDRVAIAYNFLPNTQFGWQKQYEDTMNKLDNRLPVDRQKMNIKYILTTTMSYIIVLLDQLTEIISDFLGGDKKNNNQSLREVVATMLEQEVRKSSATKSKKELNVLETQIAVISESIDKTRQENNALSACQSFRVLDEDNYLIYKKVKDTPKLDAYRFNGVESCKYSTDECQNFI